MSIIVLLVVVAVIGAVAVVLAGRSGGQAEFEPDRARFDLPAGPLDRAAIDGVRFAVGVRGYRMDQVDLLLDRLALELDQRDALIAELGGGAAPESAAPESAASAAPDVAAPDVAVQPATEVVPAEPPGSVDEA